MDSVINLISVSKDGSALMIASLIQDPAFHLRVNLSVNRVLIANGLSFPGSAQPTLEMAMVCDKMDRTSNYSYLDLVQLSISVYICA